MSATFASGGLALPLASGSGDSLVRVLLFLVLVVGPAIFKWIQEAKRKRKERAAQSETRMATQEEPAVAEPEEVEVEFDADAARRGREQWERLLRGEEPEAPPRVPPLPVAPAPQRAPARPVLTDTRALTEEPALTDTPALSDARPEAAATPGTSLEDPSGYDGRNVPRTRLGRDFAEFAGPRALASDEGGGSAKRIGDVAAFTGGPAFARSSVRGGPGELGNEAEGRDASAPQFQPRQGRRFTRATLRRSFQLAEILGPPVAMRALDSGPTRPLGWT